MYEFSNGFKCAMVGANSAPFGFKKGFAKLSMYSPCSSVKDVDLSLKAKDLAPTKTSDCIAAKTDGFLPTKADEPFPAKTSEPFSTKGDKPFSTKTSESHSTKATSTDTDKKSREHGFGGGSADGNQGADPEVAAAAERLSQRYVYRFVKRAFDVVFSFLVLVLFCWLFAIVALAIKIDDPKGSIIFKQTRVTKDGRRFTMYKFRSMYTDAEEHLSYLLKNNEKTGPVFKMRNDPRVSRVGRFLRKLSLDELPQFVNVLKGDLSVVGPRPALPSEVDKYTPYQKQRVLIKAGITCFWQTRHNRDSITFDEWVDLDLLYIKKCGPLTDLKLIVQTVGCVLTAQGS